MALEYALDKYRNDLKTCLHDIPLDLFFDILECHTQLIARSVRALMTEKDGAISSIDHFVREISEIGFQAVSAVMRDKWNEPDVHHKLQIWRISLLGSMTPLVYPTLGVPGPAVHEFDDSNKGIESFSLFRTGTLEIPLILELFEYQTLPILAPQESFDEGCGWLLVLLIELFRRPTTLIRSDTTMSENTEMFISALAEIHSFFNRLGGGSETESRRFHLLGALFLEAWSLVLRWLEISLSNFDLEERAPTTAPLYSVTASAAPLVTAWITSICIASPRSLEVLAPRSSSSAAVPGTDRLRLVINHRLTFCFILGLCKMDIETAISSGLGVAMEKLITTLNALEDPKLQESAQAAKDAVDALPKLPPTSLGEYEELMVSINYSSAS